MMDVKSKLHVYVVGAVLGAAMLTGCSANVEVGTPPTVAKTKLQSLAKEKMESAAGQKVKSVECEDGIEAKVGATQRCVLTAKDGSKIGLTATVKSVDGGIPNINFKGDDKPLE